MVGDTAGFLNVPKIKGTHTAMKSGMLAAEAVFDMLSRESLENEATSYTEAFKASWLFDELWKVRNVRPSFRWGLWGGIMYSAIDTYIFNGQAPWTLRHLHADHECLKKSQRHAKNSLSETGWENQL